MENSLNMTFNNCKMNSKAAAESYTVTVQTETEKNLNKFNSKELLNLSA